jgi:hypothetical protein
VKQFRTCRWSPAERSSLADDMEGCGTPLLGHGNPVVAKSVLHPPCPVPHGYTRSQGQLGDDCRLKQAWQRQPKIDQRRQLNTAHLLFVRRRDWNRG